MGARREGRATGRDHGVTRGERSSVARRRAGLDDHERVGGPLPCVGGRAPRAQPASALRSRTRATTRSAWPPARRRPRPSSSLRAAPRARSRRASDRRVPSRPLPRRAWRPRCGATPLRAAQLAIPGPAPRSRIDVGPSRDGGRGFARTRLRRRHTSQAHESRDRRQRHPASARLARRTTLPRDTRRRARARIARAPAG